MKKGLLLFVTFTLCASSAMAQIRVEKRYRSLGGTVRVVNATEDKSAVKVLAGNEVVVLLPGDVWEKSYFKNSFFLLTPYSQEMAVTVQVCEGVAERTIAPPPWAMDRTILGVGARSEEFLVGLPSERELQRGVDDIKDFLDDRKVLGRKRMKHDLDGWFDLVRENGLRVSRLECVRPGTAMTRVVTVRPDWAYAQQFTLTVRGGRDRHDDYRLDSNY